MEIGIAVLSGVGVTMLFFVAMFFFINKKAPKGSEAKMMEYWANAKVSAARRNELIERIAAALEHANEIELSK